MKTSRPCPWPKTPIDLAYHDTEWGVPLHDDRALFELLILEGAQAGLSWTTILNKRENYRLAFDGFDAEKIARYGARKVAALLADAGIVRNRLKIAAWIAHVLATVDHPPSLMGAAIQPYRGAVRSAAPRLEEVFVRLR